MDDSKIFELLVLHNCVIDSRCVIMLGSSRWP